MKNVLRIGTTGNEAPFLTEAELKDKEEAKLARKQVGYVLGLVAFVDNEIV